ASNIVTDVVGKGIYHARCVRSWAHDYVTTHQIPYSCRRHHAKIWSFLWDKNILLQVKSYVRKHKWNITPYILMVHMNEVILPGLGFVPSPTIHINTARNYLKELGYIYAKLRGQPKGLKQVLIERGLWPNEGLKLEGAREVM
ncbi:4496_t:CDS:2, partial [Funneliformis caledonium]